MYLIGINDFSFIKIAHQSAMYDGKRFWSEIRGLEYDAQLHEATIIPDYETAQELFQEIQSNINAIEVTNHDIVGEIFDKKDGFDKTCYISKLKIYELIPTLVTREGE